MSNDYRTVDGLKYNGCDEESTEKIVMLIQKIDECFEEHNRRCEQEVGTRND